MIPAERTALILLAAGRSERFGTANKLEADFLGKPVGQHVVTALEDVPFAARYVVVDGCTLPFDGYVRLHNDGSTPGMARSVAIGVAAARDAGADAVLVALADMPRVTAAHVYRLLDAADGAAAVVASSDGTRPCPPAVFGRERFHFLLGLDGDEGARALVAGGRHVVTSPAELIDIDTPDDLEALRRLVHDARAQITRPQYLERS